jgi:hypothetical protein
MDPIVLFGPSIDVAADYFRPERPNKEACMEAEFTRRSPDAKIGNSRASRMKPVPAVPAL